MQYRIFVGVDWGSKEHAVVVEGEDGTVIGKRTVRHDGEGLAALCEWLAKLAGGDNERVAIGIEVPHGPVVETLMERGFHVHAINPKQLDRFRDRFSVAGAKDDGFDALVLSDSLRTDMHCFRKLDVDHPLVIELREWSRMAGEISADIVAVGNMLRQQLGRYYPQILEVGSDVTKEWLLVLWELAPTPEKARRVEPRAIERVLTAHRVRQHSAREVAAILRSPGFVVAPGTAQAAVAHIRHLVARLRVLLGQRHETAQMLKTLTERFQSEVCRAQDSQGETSEQRDVEILDSLPGVGPIVLAALLAEAWRLLKQRDYHGLRAHAGVAPVTRRSGKSCLVVMRRACNERLRDALYHSARVAVQVDDHWRACYARMRACGHHHGRAIRSIGDRLLAVACAMLRDQTFYDPSRWEAKAEALVA